MAKSSEKWQFGDFQTPDDLAQAATTLLRQKHKLSPDIIIEPTCGTGAFLRAALHEFRHAEIIGFDINQHYVEDAKLSVSQHLHSDNVTVCTADFFRMDWNAFLAEHPGNLLVLGNPPWVTSSDLSRLNSQNIPSKSNFQNRRGIDAITGSGNFDISEWMLLHQAEWLTHREGAIALLCKYSVARKVLNSVRKRLVDRLSASIYLIDAKAFFGAAVQACFFVLETVSSTKDRPGSDCNVYKDLESNQILYRIGERDGLILKDTAKYDQWKHLLGEDVGGNLSQTRRYIWRSGIKHDCAKVMEFEQVDDGVFINGLRQTYVLEKDYLYPLLKSSDIGNCRTDVCRRFVLVTQKSVGDDTRIIRDNAPNTWQYLLEHDDCLRQRRSSIYKNKPPYSIFGIGAYSFKKWKIAISGLYKNLSFCLIKPIDGKPVMVDDTVNFLSFDTEEDAQYVLGLMTSTPSLECLDSMIFWDEKRPITIDLLRRLSLRSVARELGVLDRYLQWTEAVTIHASGQLELFR